METTPSEFDILREYLHWKIDMTYPTTLEFMIENYSKTGFIEYGTKPSSLPDFETYKKIYHANNSINSSNSTGNALLHRPK